MNKLLPMYCLPLALMLLQSCSVRLEKDEAMKVISEGIPPRPMHVIIMEGSPIIEIGINKLISSGYFDRNRSYGFPYYYATAKGKEAGQQETYNPGRGWFYKGVVAKQVVKEIKEILKMLSI